MRAPYFFAFAIAFLSSAHAAGWTNSTLGRYTMHSVSFCNSTSAFAVGELGVILSYSDNTWSVMADNGFPYYYYGVECLPQGVIVVGFDDKNVRDGLMMWYDESKWGPVSYLKGSGWIGNVEFTDPMRGVMTSINSPDGGIFFTSTGGKTPSDWQRLAIGGHEIYEAFQYHAGVFAGCGTAVCVSSHMPTVTCNTVGVPQLDLLGGAWWIEQQQTLYIGGGTILPKQQGYVYRSRNSGKSWSAALLKTTWPIRGLWFANASFGFAFGGDYFTQVGGVYSTVNGGVRWDMQLQVAAPIWNYAVVENTLHLLGGGSAKGPSIMYTIQL